MRRLVLKSEHLTELRPDELTGVVAGEARETTPVKGCLAELLSDYPGCDSVLRYCYSLGCTR